VRLGVFDSDVNEELVPPRCGIMSLDKLLLKVCLLFHEIPLLVCLLSHVHPVHAFLSCSCLLPLEGPMVRLAVRENISLFT
jgi:hypothetical protein